MKYFKHKTSIIDKNCIIGKNSKIWHWTHVSKNSKIGSNCTIGQNVFIGENVKIGNNVKIQNNVSIYQGVTIEDDVFCGPSVVFTNVKYPLAIKKIDNHSIDDDDIQSFMQAVLFETFESSIFSNKFLVRSICDARLKAANFSFAFSASELS